MRNAETILGIIRDRGKRDSQLDDIYRQLFNRDLYVRAYGRISKNHGAMTPGITDETVDDMSLAKIDAIIEALRFERYRWTPARRVYIPKKDGRQRPLGLPTWSDKLLQEVLRSILEAYYEPTFSDHSHGFRPGRGCHTALMTIHDCWKGTAWFIEGDIKGCFDNLDHQVMMNILRERITDNRFLRLIENLLRAGYLEEWTYHATLSGSPQGGVVSPILANIYLDKLDKYVENTLIPAYTCGTRRKINPAYKRYEYQIKKAGQARDTEQVRKLRLERRALPSIDPQDPTYRRLRYIRYADDFLLGFAGPHKEAEEIKRLLGEFIGETLRLTLSQEKTLITQGRTGKARFLGYDISVQGADTKISDDGKRHVNAGIGLHVPRTVIESKCAAYMKNGKPVHRAERLHDSPYSIVRRYQQEYRGIVQYYQLANNVRTLGKLEWVMETSMAKTLAHKLRISVNQVYKKYRATIQNGHGTYNGLRVIVQRGEGKKPLVAEWGGIPLRVTRTVMSLDDAPAPVWNDRTEVEERLLADTCELCGSHADIRVHHIRKMADLNRNGREEKPQWVKVMAARHRKTLVVCHPCHAAIHAGRYDGPRLSRT
jgi:group II intron reverse transcriptase/maturase